MLTNTFKDVVLSRLGFGCMRLPQMPDHTIDTAETEKMVGIAVDNGINYFDTAYSYHNGYSEIVIGNILKNYPRNRFYLASKYPGHQTVENYDPRATFEEQLKKCRVEYFDFYLLHNVCESCYDVYTNPKWGILDYFKEQKRIGRIRHLGFSTHARPETLKSFLDYADGAMEFCQIQLNWLDWTLQNADEKVRLLDSYGLPIWSMESIRGGALAKLGEETKARMKAMRPDESIAAWSLRWLQAKPQVKMILSGMSNSEQMLDNIKTFSEEKPLSAAENAFLAETAETLKDSVPCTKCRYCCGGCPMGLSIPEFIESYNDAKVSPNATVAMLIESLPPEKQPSACLNCGACKQVCPQGIDIPRILAELSEMYGKMPKWSDICKERAKAAERLRNQ